MADDIYKAPSSELLEADRKETNLAGRGRRFAGAMIDGTIAFLLVMPIMWWFGLWQKSMNQQALSIAETLGLALIGIVSFVLVQGYLLYSRQQTVGKWLLRMKIVGLQQERVPFGKLLGLRYLLFHIVGQVPYIGQLVLFGGLMLIFRGDRRCLHDHVAGTRVVVI